jgi:hypothetical protein
MKSENCQVSVWCSWFGRVQFTRHGSNAGSKPTAAASTMYSAAFVKLLKGGYPLFLKSYSQRSRNVGGNWRAPLESAGRGASDRMSFNI